MIRMRRRRLGFRDKVLITGIALTAGPLLLFGAAVWRQNGEFRQAAAKGCLRLADEDLNTIADNVYDLCENSRVALEHNVRQNLQVTTALMERAGSARLDSRSAVNWEAQNQFTKATSRILVPKFLINETWLGQVTDTQSTVPVVDEVRKLTGATGTIFQRILHVFHLPKQTSVLGVGIRSYCLVLIQCDFGKSLHQLLDRHVRKIVAVHGFRTPCSISARIPSFSRSSQPFPRKYSRGGVRPKSLFSLPNHPLIS